MRAVPPTDDDNPFERPSAWPKMPQGAFRIGPLPKAGARPAAPAAPAPTRVIAAPRPLGVLNGGASPSFFGGGGLGAASPATPAAAVPPPVEPTPVTEPPAPAEPAPFEVAEVEVIATPRKSPEVDEFDQPEPAGPLFAPYNPAARRRRSPMPLIAAGAVVLAGIAALAAVFAGRMKAPESPAAVASASDVAFAPQQAATTPAPPPATLPAAPATPEARALTAPPPKPAARLAALRKPPRRSGPTAPQETAAAAPQAEAAPPTLVVPPPAPALVPTPSKPVPADPAAPIPTHPASPG